MPSRSGLGQWEGRKGTCVYMWLIHVVVQWKLAQYCKTIVLQLKKKWFRYVTLLLGHIFYQAVSKEEPNWQIWILTSFNFSCPGSGGSVNGQQNAKGKWPEEEQQPGHSASGKMKVHWSLLISESRSCLVSKLGSAEPQMPGIRKELGVSVATQSFV